MKRAILLLTLILSEVSLDENEKSCRYFCGSVSSDSHRLNDANSLINSVKSLKIDRQFLPFLPDEFLSDFEGLNSLSITDSKLREIKAENLKYFPNLCRLDLSNNLIKIISNDLFTKNKELQQIYLNHNQITSINFQTVKNLKSLKYFQANGKEKFNCLVKVANFTDFENVWNQNCRKNVKQVSSTTTTEKLQTLSIISQNISTTTQPTLTPETLTQKDEIKITQIKIELDVPIKDNKFMEIYINLFLWKQKSNKIEPSEERPKKLSEFSPNQVNLVVVIASSTFGILATLYVVLLVAYCRLKFQRNSFKCEILPEIKNRKSIGCCRDHSVKFVRNEIQNSQYEEIPKVHKPPKTVPRVYENTRLDKIRVTYTDVIINQNQNENECECHYENLRMAGKRFSFKKYLNKNKRAEIKSVRFMEFDEYFQN